MAIGRAMSSSTFRPELDRCITRDGTPVVLWADADELVSLRYADDRWLVARRVAAIGDAFDLSWRGITYAAESEVICEFEEWTPAAEWITFYDQWPFRAGLRGAPSGDAIGAA